MFSDGNGAFKPEILSDALHVDLPGLDTAKVAEYIEANDTETLYRYLLLTQCNALNEALPMMFERMGGYTEMLLPNNILKPDGVLGRMVADIPEDDWRDAVQIIGWLYQYYNTELKDDTFAQLKKNVKISKERIPAATQLFTPDWIVRYMVENSLGRLWLEGHPNDALKADWKYYLDEAEQEPDVEAQLEKLRAEYRTIKPEEIKVIDPCMGSGHILVYAFDVLMQIYEAQGVTQREAAQSILQNNLYGLDIDPRAAQMAYFAVMMKARQYDRRLLTRGIQPNLYHPGSYEEGREFGSILQVDTLEPAPEQTENLFETAYEEAKMKWNFRRLLAQKYDVVVTNPPYMGASGMSAKLSEFVKKNYPDSKSDLFAVFIERCGKMVKPNGFQAMITQHAWMFLSSFEKLRAKLLNVDIVGMVHLGARAFEEIGGEVVQTTSFVIQKSHVADFKGTYCRLIEPTSQQGKEDMFLAGENRYAADQSNFSKIPGSPVAYWVSEAFFAIFDCGISIDAISRFTGSQHITANNDRFLRLQWEVSNPVRWKHYAKGGDFRKWYGNVIHVVDWSKEAKNYYKTNSTSNMLASEYVDCPGIAYTDISSKGTGFRFFEGGAFDKSGPVICSVQHFNYIIALLNSKVFSEYMNIVNPTIHLQVKDIKSFPIEIKDTSEPKITTISQECIGLSQQDWDSYETSWDFKKNPLV